jgi:hypothetical protein
MDIGKPKRIIEIEPAVLPVPDEGMPNLTPDPISEPAPATPEPVDG